MSTQIEDEADLVGLNTRITQRNKLALRLATMAGRPIQAIVNEALAEYMERHYPDAWNAVGSPAAVNRVAAEYVSQRQPQAAA